MVSDWEELRLGDAVIAGVSFSDGIRVWAHGREAGRYELRGILDGRCVSQVDIELSDEAGRTGSATLQVPGCAGESLEIQLWRRGELCASCRARLRPEEGAWKNQHVSFAVASCHQPFTEQGQLHPASTSMLAAAEAQYAQDDVAFALLMGDQLYTDAPQSKSLFDADYFASLREEESILECSGSAVRKILQRRYERFMAVPGFARLLASTATVPAPDDHEFIDNFGTHPDHGTQAWAAYKEGALQAYWDYQGCRASLAQTAPDSLGYAFEWAPLAVYGLDIRSNRVTSNGKTQAYSEQQLDALRTFLERHEQTPAFALMTSIPLVYVGSGWVDAAASVLPLGSDLHERWSHASCIEARDALLALLLEHAQRNPKQKIILLGGDVHAGSAYQIDFPDCGVQMVQLTSSPLSNEEGWLNARAGELAARVVSSVELADGRCATVTSLRGRTEAVGRNPFGGLNVGFVDVRTNAEGLATVSFRLVGHDNSDQPQTVFESGPLGRRPDPGSKLGIV